MVSATARKNMLWNPTVIQYPSKINGKTWFLHSLEGTYQEKRRCGPLQRTQESQQTIKKSIGFCMSWHIEHESSSWVPCCGKGDPTVIRKSLKSIGKHGFPAANPK